MILKSRRFVSSLLKPKKSLSLRPKKKDQSPLVPARTRFAPSPTGFLHLGSLRTALYNYLLAKSTGGQFLLRLEDTDQKRLVQGAEESLYESLKWCELLWDEGPLVGGPKEPYRQSDRSDIYRQHIGQLLDSGDAYRCFCSKERLNKLRESAQKLQPPTTVSYDRFCSHISREESDKRAVYEEYTIRFKSPEKYPPFTDLLHGTIDMQPQVNNDDIRYDDPVLMKSDGLPTYHFANVVDDHLMEITHVIRGEEWLPSTPKHIAMYKSFGWKEPSFVHIPLLTTSGDKKLSKRSGDTDVRSFRTKGILPEALVNFVALFGWAPRSDKKSEIYRLDELVQMFNVSDLTRGNAKVDDKKLYYFNKHYLGERINNNDPEIMESAYLLLKPYNVSKETSTKMVKLIAQNLHTINEIVDFAFLVLPCDLNSDHATHFLESADLANVIQIISRADSPQLSKDLDHIVKDLQSTGLKKSEIFQSLRYALIGGVPGLKIPLLIDWFGDKECKKRLQAALKRISNM
jgi:glutamyl-tRNA synthetase